MPRHLLAALSFSSWNLSNWNSPENFLSKISYRRISSTHILWEHQQIQIPLSRTDFIQMKFRFYTNILNGARMYQTHFCYLEGEETGSWNIFNTFQYLWYDSMIYQWKWYKFWFVYTLIFIKVAQKVPKIN